MEQRTRSQGHFGPSGLFEQDDGENWDQSTAGVRGAVSGRYPLHYAMGINRGEIIEDERGPRWIESHMNEYGQRWTYRAWAEMMAAPSWAVYRANHAKPQNM
jgi:hypothetical protein